MPDALTTGDRFRGTLLAASLLERDGFDAHDQMHRYCRWADTGYLSSTGRAAPPACALLSCC